MYEIVYGSRAKKDIISVRQKKALRSIINKIESLSRNPRPRGVEKLVAMDGWRIRAGKWRILYQVDDTNKTVLIYRVKYRKEAYR